MADNILSIEIEIDGKKGFAKLEKDAVNAGEEAGGIFGKNFASAAAAVFTGNILTSAISKAASSLSGIVTKSIAAASEQEDALNRLNFALESTGKLTAGTTKSFLDFAAGLQASTRFGDEAILETAATIQQLANVSVDELKRATEATLNFATALKTDTNSAALLVSKALAGQASSLSRYGLSVKQGATQAETLNNVLVALESRFGGKAQADIKTFAGVIAFASNAIGDLFEEIGNILVKSSSLINVIKLIASEVGKVTASLATLTAEGADPFKSILQTAVQIGAVLNSFVVRPAEVLLNLFNAIGLAVITVGSFITNLIILPLAETIKTAATLSQAFLGMGASIAQTMQNIVEAQAETTAEFANQTVNAFANTFETGFTTSIDEMLLKIMDAINTVNTVLPNHVAAVESVTSQSASIWLQYAKDVDKTVKAITGVVEQTLNKGVSGTLQRLGASLVQGGKAWADFQSFILGILGDMAIQIGQILIAIGLALDSLRAALAGAPGGIVVAAGVALIVLGGLLKALAGAGAVAGAATGGAGGGGTGPAETSTEVEIGPTEAQKPKTEVAINIQGNVLDRRESGLAIAEVLQEYFDTNDGVLAKA